MYFGTIKDGDQNFTQLVFNLPTIKNILNNSKTLIEEKLVNRSDVGLGIDFRV